MPQRIALYSHDAQGLGHVRRNLAIAGTLAADGDRDVLVVSGAREAGVFAMPPGVELVVLPGLGKVGRDYRSRSLGLSLDELIRMRAETMRAVLLAFAPDVLIVDKHPLGIRGELLPALESLAHEGCTRMVLGLREVLDEPATVHREWRRSGALDAVRTYYDAVWVYGDPHVYDLVRECDLDADIAELVSFTGYLGRPAGRGESAMPRDLPAGRLAACLVGGGQDGYALAAAFAAAPMPPHTTGVVVTGPFMPRAMRRVLHDAAGARDDLVVLDFLDDPQALLRRASSAITMGGYNTLCELLHMGCRTLVVPRVRPRREQHIRAHRLAAAGVVDVLDPSAATGDALGAWLADRTGPRAHPRDVIDLDGLARLPALVDALAGAPQAQLVG